MAESASIRKGDVKEGENGFGNTRIRHILWYKK
jgi:hypothetical protein